MNFWLFTPSYSHPYLIAFPSSSLAGKERLKHLLGSAFTLQKDIHWVEINLLQKLDQFFISECTVLGNACCGSWVASTYPHQQQLVLSSALRERMWKEGETLPLTAKSYSQGLTCFQIVFSPAPKYSYCCSSLQYLDFKVKVQVIIIFSNSFRKPQNVSCYSGHPVRGSELRGTWASKLFCSELGWVTGLAIVCFVPSQGVKLVWFNLSDLF